MWDPPWNGVAQHSVLGPRSTIRLSPTIWLISCYGNSCMIHDFVSPLHCFLQQLIGLSDWVWKWIRVFAAKAEVCAYMWHPPWNCVPTNTVLLPKLSSDPSVHVRPTLEWCCCKRNFSAKAACCMCKKDLGTALLQTPFYCQRGVPIHVCMWNAPWMVLLQTLFFCHSWALHVWDRPRNGTAPDIALLPKLSSNCVRQT